MGDSLLASVENYGCWCSKPTTGSAHEGQPKDELDRICRAWSQCTHCESLSTCTGSLDLSYEILADSNGNYLCDNQNECTTNRCECDVDLANSLASYFDSNTLGAFIDQEASDCARVSGTGGAGTSSGPPDACCGTSPSWLLYNSVD